MIRFRGYVEIMGDKSRAFTCGKINYALRHMNTAPGYATIHHGPSLLDMFIRSNEGTQMWGWFGSECTTRHECDMHCYQKRQRFDYNWMLIPTCSQ